MPANPKLSPAQRAVLEKLAAGIIGHVYIDPLMTCLVSRAWKWPKSSHLFVAPGTDIEVLHRFALRIGLRRQWFQVSRKGFPHYDLNQARRSKAVRAGAIELDRRAAMELIRGQWHEMPAPYASPLALSPAAPIADGRGT